MEDWTCLGQHKRQPEFPVVTRESRRKSRKTTWLPRHREEVKPVAKAAAAVQAVDQNIQEAINKAIMAISGGKKQAQKIEKI